MVKVIALYKKPEDKQKFDEYYYNVHIPLTEKIPGLKELKLTEVVGSPMGESEYYMMAEMIYEDEETMKKAMSSKEGRASGKDAMSFAGDLLTLLIGVDVEHAKKV